MSEENPLEGLTGIETETVAEAMKRTELAPLNAATYKPIPLPKAADQDILLYCVRLEHQEGFWPVVLGETTIPLVDPDKPFIYPHAEPGQRFALKSFEQPRPNIQYNEQTGAPLKMRVREWRRADDPDTVFYEHPVAALFSKIGSGKRVVEIGLWCPMLGHDDHGFLAHHGRYFALDDPSPRNKTPGACPRCQKDTDTTKDDILRRHKKWTRKVRK